MSEGRTALVLGASRALGLALAAERLDRGGRVVGTVRGTGRTGLHELAERSGTRLEVETADLADRGTLDALRRRLDGRTLDLLFDPPQAMSVQNSARNIDAIARAQAAGTITNRFAPEIIFAMVLHLATLWGEMNPDVQAAMTLPNSEKRRTIVKAAMNCLLD